MSSTLFSSLKLDQVLRMLVMRIAEATQADFCRIALLDDSGENLQVMAVYPARETDWELSVGRALPLDRLDEYKRAVEARVAVVAGGAQQKPGFEKAAPTEQAMCDAPPVIICPLIVGDEAVGVVCIGEHQRRGRGTASTARINTCQSVVNQGARAVAQALVHRELEKAFLDTVRSLAAAIDAKDPSACGHSEWVSRYAVMIGGQLKLSEQEIEELRYAGYLHDVGKIGIADGIRSKSHRLSPDQWKQMKQHVTMGERILGRVKISPAIKAAVRHHHERYDGKGYPDGNAGQDIPLVARILAVANAYEAMTSDRPHRKALGDEQALEELSCCSGSQFDPVVVDAFLTAMGHFEPCTTGAETAA